MADKIFCKGCRYLREPAPANLFSSQELNYPGVADEWQKWQESRQGRQQSEMEMFDRNEDFYFEPEFFAWCEYWTELGKSRWPVDALGRTIELYELVARRNENHDCPYFKSPTDDTSAPKSQADPEDRSSRANSEDAWQGRRGF